MKTGPSKKTMEKALAPASVIVYGPTGCGKSTNAERMRAHFGLSMIIDEFDANRCGCQLHGVLYLCTGHQVTQRRRKGGMVKVMAYEIVMAEIEAATPAEPTTLEKLIAHAPNLALTDWIPCTTPPVRDGRYQIELLGNDDGNGALADWKGGAWTWVSTGAPAGGPNGDLRENWMWRGVRRWVLQNRAPYSGNMMYLQSDNADSVEWTANLAWAMGFDTERDAIAILDKRWPFGMGNAKAVLP